MSSRNPVQNLVSIALLRAGPEDLPCSAGLMGLAIVATAAINVPVIQRFTPEAQPLLQIALLAGYNLAFLAAALWWRGHAARFIQSATALFGTDALISLVALPILLVIGSPDAASSLGALSFLLLLIWNIAVVSRILRSALDLGGALSLGLSLAYIFGGSAFVRAASGA